MVVVEAVSKIVLRMLIPAWSQRVVLLATSQSPSYAVPIPSLVLKCTAAHIVKMRFTASTASAAYTQTDRPFRQLSSFLVEAFTAAVISPLNSGE